MKTKRGPVGTNILFDLRHCITAAERLVKNLLKLFLSRKGKTLTASETTRSRMFRFAVRLAVIVIALAFAGCTWSHLMVYRRSVAVKRVTLNIFHGSVKTGRRLCSKASVGYIHYFSYSLPY